MLEILMKNIFLFFFLFLISYAVSARESMQAVNSSSPELVQAYASGVCSLGLNKSGSSCCTGFRVGNNLVMTNYHCLVCISDIYKKIVDATPFMMEPSELLYSIGKASLAKREDVIRKANKDPSFRKYNLNADDIPKGNAELKELLNRFNKDFGKINFNTLKGINSNELENSALQINKIIQVDNRLDMVLMEVNNISHKHKVLKLSYDTPLKDMPLAVIGHPHGGPQIDKKSFDITSSCKVISDYFNSPNRDHVFTHHCDTLPGNSGSPLINRLTGEVIGLHWGKNNAFNVNLGIEMREILNKFEINNKGEN